MLDQHRKGIHEQFSQILTPIGESKTPEPDTPTFAITTRSGTRTRNPLYPSQPEPMTIDHIEGTVRKEGPEGEEPSIMQDGEGPQSTAVYYPSKSSKAMIYMPKGAKDLKDLLSHKEKLEKAASSVKLSEECSTIIQKSLLQKEGDPGSFTLPCLIGPLTVKNALADLEASINLMRHSLFRRLGISKLKPTRMSILLADRSIKYPIGWVDVEEERDQNKIQADSFYPRPEPLEPLEWKAPDNRLNPSSLEPPKLEPKELPEHLEYAFLQEGNQLLVVISSSLFAIEKARLLEVLKNYKGAITWSIADIKGIDSSFCTHKILMEDEFKLSIQPQTRSLGSSCSGRPKKGMDDRSKKRERRANSSMNGDRMAHVHRLPHEYYCFLDGFSDWSLPFEIMCGASDYTVGAVLGQRKDKHFHPIHYASKTINEVQEDYTATEKEILAVILLLQVFDIEIRDKKGAENLAVDHLSRLENLNLRKLTKAKIKDLFHEEQLMTISDKGRKARLLEDKQIPSVGVFDEVFSTKMAFGGFTRDLGSFGEETDKTTTLHDDGVVDFCDGVRTWPC
ncbi:reverse transcriptase domain-containing protein [Tanacetum coccineum]